MLYFITYAIMINMKAKWKSLVILVLSVFAIFGVMITRALPVMADDFGGNDSDVTDTACATFRAFTYLCSASGKKENPDGYNNSDIRIDGGSPITIRVGFSSYGAGGGGSAWHLYSLDNFKNNSVNHAYIPHCTGTSAMTCDVTYETIKNNCGDGYYPWVMVYGWEGPRLQGNSHSDDYVAWHEPKLYGPVSLGSSGISYARYNNYTDITPDKISKKDKTLSSDAIQGLLSDRHGELHLSFEAAEKIRNKVLSLVEKDYKEGTGYYCLTKESLGSIVFRGRTTAELADVNDDSDSESSGRTRDTEYHDKSAADLPSRDQIDLTLNVGDSTSVKFKHYVKVKSPVKTAVYIANSFTDDSSNVNAIGNGITITNSASIKTGQISTEFGKKWNNTDYYVLSSKPDDTTTPYSVNINKYKMKFTKEGTYYLCEWMKVYDGSVKNIDGSDVEEEVNSPFTTKACVRIKVNKSPTTTANQRVRTSLRATGGTTIDTGIVVSSEKSIPAIQKEIGDSVVISWAHTAYDKNGTRASWRMTRYPSGGSGYTMTRILNGSTNSIVSSGRIVLDSYNGTYHFNSDPLTDYYNVRFTAAGTYQFCESFYPFYSTNANVYTATCVTYVVGTSGGAAGKSSVTGGGQTLTTSIKTNNLTGDYTVTKDLGEFDIGSETNFSFDHYGGINPSGRGYWSVSAALESGSSSGVRIGGWVGTNREPVVWLGDGKIAMDSYWTKVGSTKYYSQLSSGRLVNERSNVYRATNLQEGSYKFCQTLSVDGWTLTKACATWTVRKPQPDCDVSSNDVSNVTSYAKNDSTGAQSDDLVYAKPNDIVTWHQCYYSGVQSKANDIVTSYPNGHAEYDGSKHSEWPLTDPSANNNLEIYKDVSYWGNKYTSTFPVGSTSTFLSGSWPAGSVITTKPVSSIKISSAHVGTTMSDSIISSSPISVSISNHGKHTWECRPSATNTGGTVAETVKASYTPKEYDNVCYGTEFQECPNSGSPSTGCYKTSYPSANVTGYSYTCEGNRIYTVLSGDKCTSPSRSDTRDAHEVPSSWGCDDGDSGPYTDSGGSKYCIHRTSETAETKCRKYDGTIGYTPVERLWDKPVKWYQNPKCSHSNDYITYSVNSGPASASSSVKVPYNYNLTAGVEAGSGTLYAGETMSVKGWANVENKYNGVTRGSYTTIAYNAKAKLVAFVKDSNLTGQGGGISSSSDICSFANGKQCAVLAESSGLTLNRSGALNGITNQYIYGSAGSAQSYQAFDASAGDYICFAMAVFPASSGSDTNMGDFNGDGNWNISKYSCKIVSKKPSFQVWGAGLYSGGDVNAITATKNNLYPGDGYPAYSASSTSNRKVFRSWIEQSLILKGVTNTVASGSSSAGGSSYDNFCRYMAPLSFANYSMLPAAANGGVTMCGNPGAGNNSYVGNMGSNTGSSFGVISTRSNYVDTWLPESPVASSSGTSFSLNSYYNESISRSGVSIRYVYSAGDLSISSSTVGKNITFIVKANGNVRIRGNIYYDGSGLTTMNNIPKVIIYGKNINIDCSVGEVDAILVAEETIKTCQDGGDVNSASRGNQLYIRGVTISNKLDLGRTYGAATGKYSDYPAEIINYDSSAILWGSYMSSAGETGELRTTYLRELAPRY